VYDRFSEGFETADLKSAKDGSQLIAVTRPNAASPMHQHIAGIGAAAHPGAIFCKAHVDLAGQTDVACERIVRWVGEIDANREATIGAVREQATARHDVRSQDLQRGRAVWSDRACPDVMPNSSRKATPNAGWLSKPAMAAA